ncbi:hypothetical protein [Streptomyces sp. NPDC053069]|uniref:hypothetical protein n=1 Tax=Streptomyces sp. NPDC053069 TaxID=3365695 RepID=UPI0037CE9EFA
MTSKGSMHLLYASRTSIEHTLQLRKRKPDLRWMMVLEALITTKVLEAAMADDEELFEWWESQGWLERETPGDRANADFRYNDDDEGDDGEDWDLAGAELPSRRSDPDVEYLDTPAGSGLARSEPNAPESEESIPDLNSHGTLEPAYDPEWMLGEKEVPSERSDLERFELRVPLPGGEAAIAAQARAGSDLSRSIGTLMMLVSASIGGLSVAAVCNLAGASSTLTLALSLPTFLLCGIFTVLWVLFRRPQ